MPAERFEPLTPEVFDKRFEASNERKRLEIIELEERIRKWEALIARKEAFLARLQQTIAEIEREDDEIAAIKKSCLHYATRGGIVNPSLQCCNDYRLSAPYRPYSLCFRL